MGGRANGSTRLRVWRSSTFQFTAFYLVIFAASVVLLLALVYWTTAGFMARQTDETIQAEIAGLDEPSELRAHPKGQPGNTHQPPITTDSQ